MFLGSVDWVVLDEVAAPPERGTAPSFRPLWPNVKTPLCMEDLGPGCIVLDGDPALPRRERGIAALCFPPLFFWQKACLFLSLILTFYLLLADRGVFLCV